MTPERAVARTRWTAIVTATLLSSLPATATAAGVTLREGAITWPAASAGSPAHRRAEQWAQRLGGRPIETRASAQADDFAETLALIGLDSAIPVDIEPRRLLESTFGDAFPGELTLPEDPTPAPWVVRGRIVESPLALHVGLASDGPRKVALVFAVQLAEESVYLDRIDAAFGGLQGVTPPVHPFPVTLTWVLHGLGFVLLMPALWWLWSRRRHQGPASVGRSIALLGLGIALLVAIIEGIALQTREASLDLAGTTPWAMALAAGFIGTIAASLTAVAGLLRERAEQKVRSAPTNGVYAERRASPPPHAAVPSAPILAKQNRAHPDGNAELESARSEPAGRADL